LKARFGNGKDMKNTTPILVITGLAIAAAVGVAGLTREQWMGQPTPAEATAEPTPAPATPAETAAPAESPAQPEQTAAAPDVAPAAPEAAPAAAEQPAAAQPEQTAAVQPESAQPEAQPAPNATEQPEVPAFDTVRVEKTGEAVIAGRAEPGSEVVIKLNGEEIGKTVANSDGAFVVVPEQPLPAGSGSITIEATGKSDLQPITSEESVAVIVPEGQKQQALVAVVSPDAPTKVLQKPEPPAEEAKVAEAAPAEQPAAEQPAAEQPAAEQKPAKLVSIDAVDYDTAGNIVFSGQGEVGNTARVYVDNNFLGDAPVGEDGRWTFAGTADVAQGVHTLRVDGLDAQGNVVNRVEVPFFREEPTKVAEATPPVAPAAPAAEEPAATEAAIAEQPAQQPEAAAVEPAPAAPEQPEQDMASAEQPAAEQAVAEQPAAEQPATEQPVAEQPAAEQPAGEQPVAQEPATAEASQETTGEAQETAAATAPAAETASAPKEGRIVIQPGNNLWRISRVLYGTGNKFTMLYEANKDQIRNPNLIYPGQVFRTPEVLPRAETIDPNRRDPLQPDESAATAQ